MFKSDSENSKLVPVLIRITEEEESENNNNKIASASTATPKWTPMKVQQGYKLVLPYLLIM